MKRNFFKEGNFMLKIKEILKIGICSFCECVLQEQLLSKKEFKKSVRNFLETEEPLDNCLNMYSDEYIFDDGFIENACKEYSLQYKSLEEAIAFDCILEAFSTTIWEYKTIDIGAYMNVLLEILNDYT